MPILNVVANDLTVTDPYVIGAPPDNLTGWTQIANALRVASATPKYFLGTNSSNCIWINSTQLAGTVFYARMTLDVYGSESQGVVICSASGVGYQFIVNSSVGARLFAMTTGGVLGAQKGSTVATSSTAGEVVEVEFRVGDPSTGNVRLICKVNGVTRINFTEANANTTWYGGGVVRGSGRMRAIEVEYTAAQSVASINGGNDIEVGEAGIPAVLGGFTGAITSITTDQTGMTVSGITGTTNAPIFNLSNWTEAGDYPELPVSTQFTFNYSAESASGSETVTYPAGWVKQTFSGAIIDNDRYFGYIFNDAGHTVDGSVLYYDPAPIDGLVINPDTSWDPIANGGTFDAWLRATDGKMYYFELTIQEDGTATGRGLTSVGLTSIGLTSSGLTSVGLC